MLWTFDTARLLMHRVLIKEGLDRRDSRYKKMQGARGAVYLLTQNDFSRVTPIEVVKVSLAGDVLWRTEILKALWSSPASRR